MHLHSRIEWKLMIRAEYHDRYEIWRKCNIHDFATFNSYTIISNFEFIICQPVKFWANIMLQVTLFS